MSSSYTSQSSLTYEATKARQSTWSQPDKIHWTKSSSYRNNPYRQLHHQKGFIGMFKITLLECSNLKRSYWSAFALGPVKHLNLSKAHGPISSYCIFGLNFSMNKSNSHNGDDNNRDDSSSSSSDNLDQKPSASLHSRNNNNYDNDNNDNDNNNNISRLWNPSSNHDTVRSSVIPNNNNPVWSSSGSSGKNHGGNNNNNRNEFIIPLRKSSMIYDGMFINLLVRVDEDNGGVENVLKNVGVAPSDDERILGIGKVDVTSLCLGESINEKNGNGISPQVNVLDVWIPISRGNNGSSSGGGSDHHQKKVDDDFDDLKKPGKKDKDGDDNKNNNNDNNDDDDEKNGITGRVRVLISYMPNGLEPEHNDWVAMECFARRSMRYSSCRPILPPLYPMKVLDIRGSYVLVEYTLMKSAGGSRGNSKNSSSNINSLKRMQDKGTMRLHRNSIFVIERTNLIDGAINLACLPTDILMSTPIGKKTSEVAGPIVSSVGELIMPALLTGKILFGAVKTTASASISGVVAATSAVGHVAMENQHKYRQKASFHGDGNHDGMISDDHSHHVPLVRTMSEGRSNERFV